MQPLLRALDAPEEEETDLTRLAGFMDEPNRLLHVIRKQLGRLLTPEIRGRLEAVASAVTLFETGESAWYAASDASGSMTLCTAVSDLPVRLHNILWTQPQPIILTSATMAVRGDFRRFKQTCGLLRDPRVTQAAAASPFDYERNCLLYLPQFAPDRQDAAYYDEVSDEIIRLLRASHGHALVLFTRKWSAG